MLRGRPTGFPSVQFVMNESLSFYLDRQSSVHRVNPLTKITAAFTLIFLAFFGPGYFLPTFLVIFVLVPISFIAKVGREFIGSLIRIMIPISVFLFVMQAFFYPGGETQLIRLWVLAATVEGVQFGYLMVTRILVLFSSFFVMLLTTHPSTMMSDLARRGLPGALPFVITSTLQIIPQMQKKAATIIDAQRSRGLETEGNFKRRVGALLPLVGPLVFGSIVDVEERTIAIEARAFTVVGPKTSLVDIPDPRGEVVLRWSFLFLILLVIVVRVWLS
jgi:energy-coupling factor transport system permease protein